MVSLLKHLDGQQQRRWLILAFAVLGLTTSATVLTFFLPVLLSNITNSQLAIGFAVGVEGVAALTVPLLVGRASDATWNRYGRRLPYMLAATPLVFLGLLAVALLSSYWLIVAAVIVFFIGYYMYYTAYQALYPDVLPPSEYGRAWAYQSVFQGGGAALALLGGGALLTVSLGAPFIVSGILFVIVAALTAALVTERRRRRVSTYHGLGRALPIFVKRLRTDHQLRLFLAAHFCWEYTLAAIRAFVILYLIRGLGLSIGESLSLLTIVIFCYLIAAVISGYIADKFDPRRYMTWVISIYTIGMFIMGLTTNHDILRGILPFGMFAGAAVLMLSYPILLRITPADRRGEYTGYYQANRGLALLIGTSLTGFLIDQFGHYFEATAGYQVLWLSTGVFGLLSIPLYLWLTNTARR